MPYITVSFAQSIDGRLATKTGTSQWISGSGTLELAQRLRRDNDAIAVGIGTVLKDDPLLTCRLEGSASPLRVIFDSKLRIPLDSQIAKTARIHDTLVFTCGSASLKKRECLEEKGLEIRLTGSDGEERVSLPEAMLHLASRGCARVLVEGGAGIITSFLKTGMVGRILIVTAPIIIGQGIEAIGDLGIGRLEDAFKPLSFQVETVGQDVVWDLVFRKE